MPLTKDFRDTYDVGIPHDDRDSRHCGFPSLSAAMRGVSVAILNLPDRAEIQMVPRMRGERPINLIPEIVEAAFAIREAVKPQFTRRTMLPARDLDREPRGLAVIHSFKNNGGDVKQLFKFYRDEFDEPNDYGLSVLEKFLLNPEQSQ